jgi:hypothetical protein
MISDIQCCGSGMLSRIRIFSIPDPGSELFHPGSASNNLRILTKNWFLSSWKYDPGCSSRIRIPDPRSRGEKGTGSRIPDPGSGSATLLTYITPVGSESIPLDVRYSEEMFVWQDTPSVKATYTASITAPQGITVLMSAIRYRTRYPVPGTLNLVSLDRFLSVPPRIAGVLGGGGGGRRDMKYPTRYR